MNDYSKPHNAGIFLTGVARTENRGILGIRGFGLLFRAF